MGPERAKNTLSMDKLFVCVNFEQSPHIEQMVSVLSFRLTVEEYYFY